MWITGSLLLHPPHSKTLCPMTYNPKISLTRINTKQQTLVSTLSLSKLMEKLTVNVRNEEIQYLRHHVQYDNGRYVGSRHHKLHRLYPSVRLCKGDDGQPHPAGYNDLLLLSAGPVREEEQLLQLKRMAQVLPSTAAAFVGSSGQTLKLLVRITLPDAVRLQNEAEMERFFRKAYEVAAALYSSLLQLPVGPSGITDGSSPAMASCRLSADAQPLVSDEATPLRIDGTETSIAPPPEEQPVELEDETQRLISYLNHRYEFRYNTVRGATEYLDKEQAFWGWRATELRFINTLSIGARKAGIDARPKDVMTYLNSTLIRSIDPIDNYLYLNDEEWDGHDYIGDVADLVPTDLKEWKRWFRYWFLGMVAQWMGYNGKFGNSIVPLLIGSQGWHKSTFCRQLLPPELQWGYLDSLKFDNPRQVMQAMSDSLLINMDEFNSISRKTQEGFLKNTLQLATLPLKRPYARRTEQVKRIASFIATSNMTDVLSDPSGSRRFFVVNLTAPIQTDRRIPYRQLYAQAVRAVRDNEQRWFDSKEQKAVMSHNRQYAQLSSADLYFHEYFEPAAQTDPDAREMTSAELFSYIRKQAGATAITESLTTFGRYLSQMPGLIRLRRRNGTVYVVKQRHVHSI